MRQSLFPSRLRWTATRLVGYRHRVRSASADRSGKIGCHPGQGHPLPTRSATLRNCPFSKEASSTSAGRISGTVRSNIQRDNSFQPVAHYPVWPATDATASASRHLPPGELHRCRATVATPNWKQNPASHERSRHRRTQLELADRQAEGVLGRAKGDGNTQFHRATDRSGRGGCCRGCTAAQRDCGQCEREYGESTDNS